jgi:hypothetical protein
MSRAEPRRVSVQRRYDKVRGHTANASANLCYLSSEKDKAYIMPQACNQPPRSDTVRATRRRQSCDG